MGLLEIGERNMTEEELNVIVESKLADRLAARLQADRDRVRLEVISEIRREADRAWYDRINRRAPIEDKYGGLGPEGHAKRLALMDAGAKADKEWHDRVNSQPIPGSLATGAADQMGGASGFRVKRLGET
jgi:hypothetical protein